MKIKLVLLVLLGALLGASKTATAALANNTTNTTDLSPSTQATPYAVVDIGQNHKTWQRTTTTTLPDGRTAITTNRYTELSTSMAYQKDGAWVESSPNINPADGGAAATNTVHQAFFAINANVPEALRLTTPEGKVLSSHVMCLSYFDTSSGNNVVIADLHDSVGQIMGSNQVLYPSALQGDCTADILYENKKAGLEQNIVLKTWVSPTEYGMDSSKVVIQVWSEFVNSPMPSTATVATLDSGIEDQRIDFGVMKMGPGSGFILDPAAPRSKRTRVLKQWVNAQNRSFLVEQIPLRNILAQLQSSLPTVSPSGTNSPTPTNTPSGAFLRRPAPLECLPPVRFAKANRNQMQIAALDRGMPRGYLIDYSMLSSQTNCTLQGDTTYFVSDYVGLSGRTVIEGGTVVKFSNNGPFIGIGGFPNDSIECQTSAYRPAVFTAIDDDSAGETVDASNGNPSGTYASIALDISGPTNELKYIRMKYADMGVVFDLCPGHSTLRLKNSQFNLCNAPIVGYSENATLELQNLLIWKCSDAIEGGLGGLQVNAQHLTIDRCNNVAMDDSSATLRLTNSLLVAVTNWGNFGTITTNFVATNGNPAAVFQTVGGASHYLAGNSYRNLGTTNIPPSLLAEIRTKTTFPPIVFSNITINTDTNFSPQDIADSDPPDLGYHYDKLEYAFGGVLANANLSFAPGVASAWFFPDGGDYTYGIALADTKVVSFNGLADSPDYWVNSGTVQEGGNGNWQSLNGRAGITGSAWPYLTDSPQVNASFTRFSGFGNNFHYGDFFGWIIANANNSEFYSGYGGGWNLGHHYTNCLFARTGIYFYTDHSPSSFSMRNCTAHGGLVSPTRFDDGTGAAVVIRECAFDGTSLSATTDGPGATYYNYNAFGTNCTGSLPGGSGDKPITNFNWQTVWLGNFYLPTNSPLINASPLLATDLGLFHFTTQTNQTKEASTYLDIGYHRVALDANGKPIDSNGDGTPDYVSDKNGNGVWDFGEIPFGITIETPANGSIIQR